MDATQIDHEGSQGVQGPHDLCINPAGLALPSPSAETVVSSPVDEGFVDGEAFDSDNDNGKTVSLPSEASDCDVGNRWNPGENDRQTDHDDQEEEKEDAEGESDDNACRCQYHCSHHCPGKDNRNHHEEDGNQEKEDGSQTSTEQSPPTISTVTDDAIPHASNNDGSDNDEMTPGETNGSSGKGKRPDHPTHSAEAEPDTSGPALYSRPAKRPRGAGPSSPAGQTVSSDEETLSLSPAEAEAEAIAQRIAGAMAAAAAAEGAEAEAIMREIRDIEYNLRWRAFLHSRTDFSLYNWFVSRPPILGWPSMTSPWAYGRSEAHRPAPQPIEPRIPRRCSCRMENEADNNHQEEQDQGQEQEQEQ
ncbi:hypothetical protein QBC43DRAFT_291917 [Cladorrhinum sp. PSN259]|nr:hypothetical protein QBC43DRAFT_291917 [Cladorrhinum sp. PSN259]